MTNSKIWPIVASNTAKGGDSVTTVISESVPGTSLFRKFRKVVNGSPWTKQSPQRVEFYVGSADVESIVMTTNGRVTTVRMVIK